jgi:hypothetical protein
VHQAETLDIIEFGSSDYCCHDAMVAVTARLEDSPVGGLAA